MRGKKMAEIQLTIDGREVQAKRERPSWRPPGRRGSRFPTSVTAKTSLRPRAAACAWWRWKGPGRSSLPAPIRRPTRWWCAPIRSGCRTRDKLVVELLLSDHPYDCMTCEKSGTCLLEKYAYQFGDPQASLPGRTARLPPAGLQPFLRAGLQQVHPLRTVRHGLP